MDSLLADHDPEVQADSNRADFKVDRGRAVFPRRVPDQVVPLNVLVVRPVQLPARTVGQPVEPARAGPRISSLVGFLICRETVTSVVEGLSSTAGTSSLAALRPVVPLGANEWPTGVTVCPTGARNQCRTEQTG